MKNLEQLITTLETELQNLNSVIPYTNKKAKERTNDRETKVSNIIAKSVFLENQCHEMQKGISKIHGFLPIILAKMKKVNNVIKPNAVALQ